MLNTNKVNSKTLSIITLLVTLLLAGLLAGCTQQHKAVLGDAPEGSFTIIHTNDVHGYIQADEETLGMAAVTQLTADYETKGGDVLLFDAGDALQGNTLVNLSEGAVVPELMNTAGYDVMAIGNHEFDYGPDVLEQRISECKFPVLSANITVDSTGKQFAQPNTVFELQNGIKLGVFGLTTPSTKTQSSPKNTLGLTFDADKKLFETAQKQADELRAQGCQVVICLAHLGEEPDVGDNKATDVAAHTSGINIFINAHDHVVQNQSVKNAAGEDVPIVETGSYLANIGVLTYKDGTWTEELVAAGSYDGADVAVAAHVDDIAAQVDKQLGEVIGTTPFVLNGEKAPGNRDRETNYGDLITDAFLWQATNAATKAPDAAIINGGGIRTSVDEGEITLREVVDTMPFGNQLVTIQVTGEQLLEALEAATQGLPEPMGGFPQVAGITYSVDLSVPYEEGEAYPDTTYFAPANPGKRVTISEVGGKPFDPQATYTIATFDFIAMGGDTYYCFIEASQESIEYTGYLDMKALQNYLVDELDGTVPEAYAEPQGRITITGQ